METPERLAKLRELFKVGSAVKYTQGADGRLTPDKQVPADGVPVEVFNAIVKGDPTAKVSASGEVEKCGIYSQWLLNQYVKSNSGAKSRFIEDLYKATDALAIYDRRKGKLPVEQRNITAIKTIIDLENIVDTLKDKQTQGEVDREIKAAVTKVLETADWLVLVPSTHAAARYYGAGTRWCTASESSYYFDHYTKAGPLYIVIHKTSVDTEGRADKFQFHFETQQFMDENDSSIDVTGFFNQHPEIGAAILKFLRSQKQTVSVQVLEIIAPGELLTEYAQLDPASLDAKRYLGSLSMPTVLTGFETGVIPEPVLNAEFSHRMVFDAAGKRIAYRVSDLSEMSMFFEKDQRDTFESVCDYSLFDNYYSGITVDSAKDSIDAENLAKMVEFARAEDAEEYLDEDGELQWDNLPDELESAVTHAADDAQRSADEDMWHTKYVDALSPIGKVDYNTDKNGGVLFWNTIEGVRSDLKEIGENTPDRIEPGAMLDALAEAKTSNGKECEPSGDSRYWYASMDDDYFNERLTERLSELEHERSSRVRAEELKRQPELNLESILEALVNRD